MFLKCLSQRRKGFQGELGDKRILGGNRLSNLIPIIFSNVFVNLNRAATGPMTVLAVLLWA